MDILQPYTEGVEIKSDDQRLAEVKSLLSQYAPAGAKISETGKAVLANSKSWTHLVLTQQPHNFKLLLKS